MNAVEQATWCLLTGQSPQTWKELSHLEREAFEQAAKRSM